MQTSNYMNIASALDETAKKSPDKIAISTTGLPNGIYNYFLEITAATGKVIRIIHKINSSLWVM